MEKVKFGSTDMTVFPIALGGYPFAGIHRAQGWDPYTPEGQKEAVKTVHAALDEGINYIDTAPGYGKGHSESIIGEALKTRRGACYVATKCPWTGKEEVLGSIRESLKRLNTDCVDVLQLHGGRFSHEDSLRILEGGPLEGLQEARRLGYTRYIGVTAEEPWTALPLLRSGAFDVFQICYNLIRQSAGQHFLDEARERGVAVCAMRPMTSGMFQRQLETLAPQWLENGEAYRVCLKFILADSRGHMANVGMRWPREVVENVRFVREFNPAWDVAQTPKLTQLIYETDDARSGV
jgi:aryl-alcohol dehydrogenase-like predicted oxidoreductase